MSALDAVRVAWERVPEGRPRRDTAWRLLRDLLPHAVLTNPCPFCGGPHGPVRVAGVPAVASVSYAGGWAVAAVADAAVAGALGLDAETPDAAAGGGAAASGLERVLPGAGLRDWTRVEAVLKADGRGLRVDPARVRIEPGAGDWTAALDGVGYEGRDVSGPAGLLLAVAVRRAG